MSSLKQALFSKCEGIIRSVSVIMDGRAVTKKKCVPFKAGISYKAFR